MTMDGDEGDTEHAAQLNSALAATQRLEREEQQADLDRQHDADERIVEALSHRDEG